MSTSSDQTPIAAWRARLGLSQRAAAAALGLTLRAYQQQERGRAWTDGRPMTPPRTLLLACAAIEHGIAPIEGAAASSPGQIPSAESVIAALTALGTSGFSVEDAARALSRPLHSDGGDDA